LKKIERKLIKKFTQLEEKFTKLEEEKSKMLEEEKSRKLKEGYITKTFTQLEEKIKRLEEDNKRLTTIIKRELTFQYSSSHYWWNLTKRTLYKISLFFPIFVFGGVALSVAIWSL